MAPLVVAGEGVPGRRNSEPVIAMLWTTVTLHNSVPPRGVFESLMLRWMCDVDGEPSEPRAERELAGDMPPDPLLFGCTRRRSAGRAFGDGRPLAHVP